MAVDDEGHELVLLVTHASSYRLRDCRRCHGRIQSLSKLPVCHVEAGPPGGDFAY